MKKNIYSYIVIALLSLALIVSMGVNFIFYKADVEYWLAYKEITGIENSMPDTVKDINDFHSKLIDGATDFLKGEKRIELPVYSDINFTERFRKSIHKEKRPIMGIIWAEADAYLFLELLEDAMILNDRTKLNYLKSYFDSHTLNLPFEHREQAMQALISIKLYKIYGEHKYKEHADLMYRWLCGQNTDYGILYIPGIEAQLVDVLGMVVPFLSEYAKVFDCPQAYSLAVQQIELYTKYGCDKETGMPSFAYSISAPPH